MSNKCYVIGLSPYNGQRDDAISTWYYLDRLQHRDAGTFSERVVFRVINGGWTATLYKDGTFLCNGKANTPYRWVIRAFEEVEDTMHYNEAIWSVERKCRT